MPYKPKNVNDINKHELIEWVVKYVEGMGVPSTVHYTELMGEPNDIEEWAVPLSILPQVIKDLKNVIEP